MAALRSHTTTRTVKPFTIEVIYSYTGGGQEFAQAEFDAWPQSDMEFLGNLLALCPLSLRASHGGSVSMGHVFKISCMILSPEAQQGTPMFQDVPEYYSDRWGKYYMNTEINKDADTAACKRYRDAFTSEVPAFASKWTRVPSRWAVTEDE